MSDGKKNVGDIFDSYAKKARQKARSSGKKGSTGGSRKVFDKHDVEDATSSYLGKKGGGATKKSSEASGKGAKDKKDPRHVDTRNRVKEDVQNRITDTYKPGGRTKGSDAGDAAVRQVVHPSGQPGGFKKGGTGKGKNKGASPNGEPGDANSGENAAAVLNSPKKKGGEKKKGKSGSVLSPLGAMGAASGSPADILRGGVNRGRGESGSEDGAGDRRERLSKLGATNPLRAGGLGGLSSAGARGGPSSLAMSPFSAMSGRSGGAPGSMAGRTLKAFIGLPNKESSNDSTPAGKIRDLEKKKRKVKIYAGAAAAAAAMLLLIIVMATVSIVVQTVNQQAAGMLMQNTILMDNGVAEEPEQDSGDGDSGEDSGGYDTGTDAGDSADGGSGERLYGADGGGDSAVEGLSQRQLENAKHVLNATKKAGLSQKATEDVFTAVWVESHFWNLANDGSGLQGALKEDQDPEELKKSMEHPESDGLPSDHGYGHGGDHGSVGLLQQQFPWWGTVDELMTQEIAVQKFIEKYQSLDVEGMESAMAIQKVQASAFGDGSNYRQGRPTALKALEEVSKDD